MTSIHRKPSVEPAPVERHMSRLIEEPLPDGTLRQHRMSIAEVERDAEGRVIAYRVFPYERELPFTTYHDSPWRLS